MKQRVALIALLAVTVVFTVSACGAGVHKTFHQQVLADLGAETVSAPHPCGYLGVGKGWHVHASSGPTCGAARHVVRRFLSQCRRAQRKAGTTCGIAGYTCVELARQPDTGIVWCATAIRSVTATSNA